MACGVSPVGGPITRDAVWATSMLLLAVVMSGGACSQESSSSPTAPTGPLETSGPTLTPPVYVTLFTHIEDNAPAGALGTPASRSAYARMRAQLIQMGQMAPQSGVPWSLQPDWKILEAARLYEDAEMTASTGGLNVFRYLRDTLNVVIDPHSHENGGYNYTDVAYLLELLEVGGSTVIGGHIWDPSYPQFSNWERFRVPVFGERYPSAVWRGNILMGSGTPGHVNDPVVSGVWRPRSRFSYFEDDPTGNIAAIGQWRRDIAGIVELTERYSSGLVPATCMLTASFHVTPGSLSNLGAVQSNVLSPLRSLRNRGQIELTDFTGLISTWRNRFGGEACVHTPTTTSIKEVAPRVPTSTTRRRSR